MNRFSLSRCFDTLAGWWLSRRMKGGAWVMIRNDDGRVIGRGTHAGRVVPFISREVDGEPVPMAPLGCGRHRGRMSAPTPVVR